ncbi:cysteine-rich and transmembrane domain-containing protein WIH1-like [Hibiscus syriacus]|uniref:cysteine-rich and transmembrane domain-containing protein WIH1-like n=1 Tax=Hibiscus syriacus TaxID=106335 RepID=UPI0019213162|nr:cysteine-rich and transmembrane domain-containing protein WIH1-like [Hibiscus syriacus]
MSYYSHQQPPVGAPPPQGYPPKDAYPPPAPGYPVEPYPHPPAQYTTDSPRQQKKETGFLEGCLAALCCCCLLDACF